EQSPAVLKNRGEFPIFINNLPIRTDKDGRFEIRGLIPGLTYTAGVTGIDTVNGRQYAIEQGLIFIDPTIEPGQAKNLADLKIKPPARGDADQAVNPAPNDQAKTTGGEQIKGCVRDAAGKTVAGAKIHWIETRYPDPNPLPPRLLSTSDASGNFTCTL